MTDDMAAERGIREENERKRDQKGRTHSAKRFRTIRNILVLRVFRWGQRPKATRALHASCTEEKAAALNCSVLPSTVERCDNALANRPCGSDGGMLCSSGLVPATALR